MTFETWLSEHYQEKGPVKWLAFLLECVTAVVLLGLMLLTCADVIGRYFFDNAVDGAVEITEIALAVVVFAELPVAQKPDSHP